MSQFLVGNQFSPRATSESVPCLRLLPSCTGFDESHFDLGLEGKMRINSIFLSLLLSLAWGPPASEYVAGLGCY